MSSELAALEELRGRCKAIEICYLDTGIRMRPAQELIEKTMQSAVKGPLNPQELSDLIDELYDLRAYLSDIMKDYPETEVEFAPTIKVIDWLLGS